jgi:hypothetical protein
LSAGACSCPLEPPCWVDAAGVKGRKYEREMHVPKHALFASPSSGGAGRSPYGRAAAQLLPTCPPSRCLGRLARRRRRRLRRSDIRRRRNGCVRLNRRWLCMLEWSTPRVVRGRGRRRRRSEPVVRLLLPTPAAPAATSSTSASPALRVRGRGRCRCILLGCCVLGVRRLVRRLVWWLVHRGRRVLWWWRRASSGSARATPHVLPHSDTLPLARCCLPVRR